MAAVSGIYLATTEYWIEIGVNGMQLMCARRRQTWKGKKDMEYNKIIIKINRVLYVIFFPFFPFFSFPFFIIMWMWIQLDLVCNICCWISYRFCTFFHFNSFCCLFFVKHGKWIFFRILITFSYFFVFRSFSPIAFSFYSWALIICFAVLADFD